MKKIVRQQNYLKELIETQGNRFLSKRALKCLVRSALEVLLDKPEDGVVLYRIENKDGLQGLLKRLEYSDIISHCYNDDSKNLIEKVWANTEFLCVLTHRYVAILIWDTNTGDKNSVRYYSLYNSKLQYEPLDVIKRNSKVDITEYIQKYNPDRRDNVLLNSSIQKLLENLEEAASDAVLGYAERSAETLSDVDYASQKTRVIAHEIKNQLSICDLYTEIIYKHINNTKIDIDGIKKSISAISKAIKMANNSLLSLKTDGKAKLVEVSVKDIVVIAMELAQVYTENKSISVEIDNNLEFNILADKDKLIAVIINLVKNAAEAFLPDEIDENKNGKYIKIKTEKEGNTALICISNNAPGITDPERIFESGFTTKKTGSGLGLWICKKSIEEQLGQLDLERASEDYTEFVIRLGIVEGGE